MGKQAEQLELRDFKRWQVWLREGHGGGVITTPGQLEWLMRKHRDRLVSSGQLILRSGPGGHFVGPQFGAVLLRLIRAESRVQAAAARPHAPADVA